MPTASNGPSDRPHLRRPPDSRLHPRSVFDRARTARTSCLALRGRTVDVGLRFLPALLCGFATRFAAVEVALFEVDAAVAAGNARLVGGVGEGGPGEGEVC